MKTLNIKQNQEPEIFIDPETKEYLGFAGTVELYDSEIYVDTRTGQGYDKVMDKLSKFINYLSNKYNLADSTREDMQQDVSVYILEGIPKYDPRKNTKLSTFLQMRINRRLINDIRNQGRDIRNPVTTKTTLYSVRCSYCESKFIISLSGEENINDEQCTYCEQNLTGSKAFPINHMPQPLSATKLQVFIEASGNERLDIYDIISPNSFDIPLVFGETPELEDKIIFQDTVRNIFDNIDDVSRQLLELVCFKDYSVKTAAKKLGISHTTASNKIKKLKKKQAVKELLKDG